MKFKGKNSGKPAENTPATAVDSVPETGPEVVVEVAAEPGLVAVPALEVAREAPQVVFGGMAPQGVFEGMEASQASQAGAPAAAVDVPDLAVKNAKIPDPAPLTAAAE